MRAYRWLCDVPLRGDKDALRVNWLLVEIRNPKGKVTYRNSFITDLPVTRETVTELAACGRARWKIENESFNVLKTSGYHLEHTFGHGPTNSQPLYSKESNSHLIQSIWRIFEKGGIRMMFKLSEEHEMIRKMVRDFAENEVAPTAAERDEEERFDREIFEKMAELGLTGIPWPEKYGGIGSDYLAYCIAVEELSRVCASTGVTLSAHTSLAGWPLYTFGTEEQKQKYLRPMAQGEKIGAYGLTEPGIGSDAGGMKTTAKLDGEDYILNGSKIFITNGGDS